MIPSMSLIQALIGLWQRVTFGGDGEPEVIRATHKKLEEEARELMLALAASDYAADEKVADELADCLIVLLGMADRLGLNAYAEVVRKMAVNRARTWPKAKPGEVVRHLAEGDVITNSGRAHAFEIGGGEGCVVPAQILGSDPT